MQWPVPWRVEEFAEEVAIEPGDREPFRATRRAGQDIDILGAEPAFADETQGARACEQDQGRHPLEC